MNLSNNFKFLPIFLLSFLILPQGVLADGVKTVGTSSFNLTMENRTRQCIHCEKPFNITYDIPLVDLGSMNLSLQNFNISASLNPKYPSKVSNTKLLKLYNISYNRTAVVGHNYTNGTLHDNGTLTNATNGFLNWTVTNSTTNSTILNKTDVYDYSLTDNWWTENESEPIYGTATKYKQEWREPNKMNWMKLEEGEHNRFKVVSDIGTNNSVSGSVLFEYSYDTGIFGVGTISGSFTIDPAWWNSSWGAYKNVTFTEQSGNDLTNYPVEYWFDHEGKGTGRL